MPGCFKLTSLFVKFTVNIDSTVGAVGFVPRYALQLYPVALVRVSETTGELIRGKDGLCIRCKPGKLLLIFGPCLLSCLLHANKISLLLLFLFIPLLY